MIVAFDAYRRLSFVGIASVVILHLAGGLVVSDVYFPRKMKLKIQTLFNLRDNGCAISLPLAFVVTLASCGYAALVMRKRHGFSRLE